MGMNRSVKQSAQKLESSVMSPVNHMEAAKIFSDLCTLRNDLTVAIDSLSVKALCDPVFAEIISEFGDAVRRLHDLGEYLSDFHSDTDISY